MAIDKKVCVGGTFDHLHQGHKALLNKAFEFSHILVGLTSDKYCKNKEDVRPYKKRYKELFRYITSNYSYNFEIIKIDDIYGFSTEIDDLDSIIVTEETKKNAQKINKKRIQKNMNPLNIIEIPLVKNKRGEKISSTNLRKN